MLVACPVCVIKVVKKDKTKRQENKKKIVYKTKIVEKETKEEMRDFWKETQENSEYTFYEITT